MNRLTQSAGLSAQDDKIAGLMQEAADARILSSAEVARRFAALEARVGIVEDEIVENTKVMTELRDELRAGIGKDMKEMVEMFGSLKGGLRVMGWLGTLAKWIVGLGAGYAMLYALVKNLGVIK